MGIFNFFSNKEKSSNTFGDKRESNLVRIKNTLARCKKLNEDTVFLVSNSSCPICKTYNRKRYSISGKSSVYPKLPYEISEQGGFCNSCPISITIIFDGISPNFDSRKTDPRLSSEEKLVKQCLKKEKNLIEAVKAYKKLSGVSLKQAKETVDKYR